jgi:hypothetical protein
MRRRLVLACVALLTAWPAMGQVVTVPVQSLWQGLTSGVTLATSVSIYGYTSKSAIPHILQKVDLGPISPLQSELRAEFPGFKSVSMTVMQLKLNSTASGSTFQSDVQTVTPTKPLAVSVPAGQKLWVVYKAPIGQPGQLSFYVGSPPPSPTATSTSTTAPRTGTSPDGTVLPPVTQIVDAQGGVWTVGADLHGRGPIPLLNGKDTSAATWGCYRLEYRGGKVYCYGGQGWIVWTGSDWIAGAPTTAATSTPTTSHKTVTDSTSSRKTA